MQNQTKIILSVSAVVLLGLAFSFSNNSLNKGSFIKFADDCTRIDDQDITTGIQTGTPYTIQSPGTYCLVESTGGLIVNHNNPFLIRIDSSDVTLDLQGNYLKNPGAPGFPLYQIGIYAENVSNIKIEGGTLLGNRIFLRNVSNSSLNKITFEQTSGDVIGIENSKKIYIKSNVIDGATPIPGQSPGGMALDLNNAGIYIEKNEFKNLLYAIRPGAGAGVNTGTFQNNTLCNVGSILQVPSTGGSFPPPPAPQLQQANNSVLQPPC